MMRADITGGYSPCLLAWPYKMRRIRYGAAARWVGGGVVVVGHTGFCFGFFFFFYIQSTVGILNKGKSARA